MTEFVQSVRITDYIFYTKMVVAAFPVAKLGALILKQISKPIASFAKERAKQNPFFRTYICMPPAQCKSNRLRKINEISVNNFFIWDTRIICWVYVITLCKHKHVYKTVQIKISVQSY